MKKAILGIALFFKRPSIIGRLILLGFPLLLFNIVIIPDARFRMSMSSPAEYTIEELSVIDRKDIPRYIKIKDAQALKSSIGLESLLKKTDTTVVNASLSSFKLETYQYVLSQSINKRGDTSIAHVIFPVYSSKVIAENPDKRTDALTAYVVVKDSKFTKYHEQNNNYFTDDKFSIEGRYDSDNSEASALEELRNSGFLLSDNVIVLNKGQEAASWNTIIVISLLGIFLITFSALSFFPESTLRNIFEELPDVREIR